MQSCRCWGVITSDISISYKDNSFEWQLEATVDIERFEEIEDIFKIRIPPIIISHGNHQVVDTVHHAGLEYILQELVVRISPPGLDFQNYAAISAYSVSIKELVYLVVHAKQNRDFDFVVSCFALFDPEPQSLQLRGNRLQNFIALQGMSWRINLTNMAIKTVYYLFDCFVNPNRTGK